MKAVRLTFLLICIVVTKACSPKRARNFDSTECTTYYNTPGKCIPVKTCPEIDSQLDFSKHHVPEILKQDTCGIHFHVLYVCCPLHQHHDAYPNYGRDSKFLATTTEQKIGNSEPDLDFLPDEPEKDWNDGRPSKIIESTTEDTNPVSDFSTEEPSALSFPLNTHPNRRLLPTDDCGTSLNDKIFGGNTTRINEFPWMALLQYRTPNGELSFGCGGSLISQRYVLTAAHCINVTDRAGNKWTLHKVRLGEWDLNSTRDCQGTEIRVCNDEPQDLRIEEVRVPSNYTVQPGSPNDVALIRLSVLANLTIFVNPICLPIDNAKNYEGKMLTVAGWGRTQRVAMSQIKQSVDVPVVEWNQCRKFYEDKKVALVTSQLCAGGEKGKDSCQGDSGGPLMGLDDFESRWFAVGIVSFGLNFCGVENAPAVYTKVSDFTDWILDNIRP